MAKAIDREEEVGRGRLLDAWDQPEGAGRAVGCLATSYTFSPLFFETECLPRFLGLDSDAEDDRLRFVIEQEELMAPLLAAAALVDKDHCAGRRSLRWDLIPARLPRRRMHAKITVLAWERRTRLIVASANLTEDGYRRNQEVYGALDYHEGSLAPLEVLSRISRFLRRLVRACVVDGEGSPSVQRWNSLLSRIDRTPTSWGTSESGTSRQPVRVFPVLGGLDSSSVLAQLTSLWPAPSPPQHALVVSPFFDPNPEDNQAALALGGLLRKRGEATIQYCVSAEEIPGCGDKLVHAPGYLLSTRPPGRDAIGVEFAWVTDEGSRPLHTKALWLRDDRYHLYMVGSSNFTKAGLGLDGWGNVEANLAYLVDGQRHAEALERLEVCFPACEGLDPAHEVQR